MSIKSRLSRRDFLRASATAAVGVIAASCAQPTPQVVKETVVVEKPVEKIVKETVVVKETVPVQQTVLVEKQIQVEKIVTATPPPMTYKEAPMLADLVKAGKLPPVKDRLPASPLIMDVVEDIGQYGGTWRRGYNGMADRWNAAKLEEGMLVRWFQPQGGTVSLRPYVCEKWETNKDATEFTWYFRKGIKWSDGTPMTTKDVQFWYEDIVKTGIYILPTIYKPQGKDMVIEIVDDYTFKTKFAAANPLVPIWIASTEGLSSGRGPTFGEPAHYMKQFHPKYAKKEDVDKAVAKYKAAKWEDLFGTWGAISSMFTNQDRPVIIAWKMTVPPPSEVVIMERNPYFWQVDKAGNQLPYIDRVQMTLFQNVDVFNLRILNGEIDCQSRHVAAANYTLFKQGEAKGNYRVLTNVATSTSAYTPVPSFGEKDDPTMWKLLNNVKFRQAISVAINRARIADLVYDDTFKPRQASPIPGTPEYDAAWEKSYAQYDKALANKMLDELGLDKRDADGFRLRSDGKQLSLLIEYAETWANPDEVLMVQEDWQAVGIKTPVRTITRELSEERMASNQQPLYVWGWGLAVGLGMFEVLIDLPGQYSMWYNSSGKTGWAPPADHPIREVWSLFEKVKVEADEAKRWEYWLKIRDINRDQLWRIGVAGAGPAYYIVKNNFRNVPSGLIDDNTLRNEGLGMPQQFYMKQA